MWGIKKVDYIVLDIDKKTFENIFEQRQIEFVVPYIGTGQWHQQFSLDNEFVRFIYDNSYSEAWYMDLKIRKIVEQKIHLGDIIDYSKPGIILKNKRTQLVSEATFQPVTYNLKSNIMDKSKLKLASVKLVNGGMKGIEVEYILPSIERNVQFNDVYRSKRKAPIHTELEQCFNWLPNYLLDICGYSLEKEERAYLLNCTSVNKVSYSDKGIILEGTLAVCGGMKELILKTPLIANEVDFPDFGKLISIINGIYSETADYLDGKKVVTDTQLVMRFNAKNEEFDHESFKRMTVSEQREIATQILEDMGCMVFHNDEIGTDETIETVAIDDTHERREPFQKNIIDEAIDLTQESLTNSGTIDRDEIHKTVHATGYSHVEDHTYIQPETTITTTSDDDGFILPVTKKEPALASTKRKPKV